jgi:putative endonuclease
MKTYYVYMLRCADASFYIGITSNLDRRLAEHDLGLSRTAYTFTRRPVTLVFSQSFTHVDDAIAAEKRLKGWSRAKKHALIGRDWKTIHELAKRPSSRVHASRASA